MRAWLLLIAACALCACSNESLSPLQGSSSSSTGAGPDPTSSGPTSPPDGGTDAGPDAAPPASLLDRPPELPRPPGSRLPDDLKPPVR
ncbi:hypothetical protein [Sorangium cellulosum]|uniref:Secreted protein n=1 Tax=Sorangium cellulosum TaxID=56 RepID=A0A150QGY3_SORCE|nr:hypothetical protein [Sorangium cellulosum]KYF67200.1 hypothetical protein BE15_36840 [Sorangium cellulosum]